MSPPINRSFLALLSTGPSVRLFVRMYMYIGLQVHIRNVIQFTNDNVLYLKI